MIFRWMSLAISLLSLAISGTGGAKAGELTAVITQVRETAQAVHLAGPGVGPVPSANPWLVVRDGVRFTIPKGARVGVVCSTRHFVRIEGPASWSLSKKACAAGRLLNPADYALVAPQGGRFKVVRDLQVLEREIRGDGEDPFAPIVVSPRNTAVRTARPSTLWIRVPAATEYRIEWNGSGGQAIKLSLEAEKVDCTGVRDDLAVCSLPWPADRPGVAPGQTFFLTVSARKELMGPWHEDGAVAIRSLTAEEAKRLEARLQELESLGLEGAARETARAGLLAQSGLYSEAAEAYRKTLAYAPTPALEVTLADLDLTTGLHRFAGPRYLRVLESRDSGVHAQAAASFGLGRIEYSRANYSEALRWFRKARDLFAQAGLAEDEKAAGAAVKEAESRVPK